MKNMRRFGHRCQKKAFAFFTFLLCSGGTTLAAPAAPPLTAETSDVATLPNFSDHWALIATNNVAFTLYDGDKGTILGTVPAKMIDNIAISSDRAKIYAAVSMWSREDHGTREDFLQEYDAQHLALEHEIDLPPRALAVFKQQNLELSADGQWAYIFNMSPATGVSIVELHDRKVVRTVDTPGCALIFPWAHGGFSSLCGNGSLTNVAFDGKKAQVTQTKSFFDADIDPVFEQSQVDRHTGQALFVTYTGMVYPATLSAQPVLGQPWSLQEAASQPKAGTGVQELAWRPGGKQPFFWHKADNRLYVLMHTGTYWTHKQDGTEVWVYDVVQHRLLQRIALPGPTASIAVSPDTKHPLLFAVQPSGKLFILSAESGEVTKTIEARVAGFLVVPTP
ncbi:amine dehydrogenase large subunit [Acetobacter syzygii]|uniref:amine dehydrogenase large subunit n=1 Tax=Acetobacter syzygii TaxID=146476 RepID=UPI0020C662AC|nr:amine dehydrogenase large subunit [Acetobacter syzygii]